MWAPCSAAILHASDRYRASRAISFPTAVTASTGMPHSSASFTSLPRLTMVWYSYFEPTNMDIAKAVAFSRTASRMLTVMSSRDRSSPIMLVPPDTRSTMGVPVEVETDVRSTPRVSMSESQYFSSGAMVLRGSSNLSVGPRKYPWSTASIRARLWGRLTMRASRFSSPQSM